MAPGKSVCWSIRSQKFVLFPKTNLCRLPPVRRKDRIPLSRRSSSWRTGYGEYWKRRSYFHILRVQDKQQHKRAYLASDTIEGGSHGKAEHDATVRRLENAVEASGDIRRDQRHH